MSEDCKIEQLFNHSIETKQACIGRGFQQLYKMSEYITQSIQNGGKIMLCGNGGSAADAQHLAAEMLVRLRPMNNREGVAAITLAQDTSTITACGKERVAPTSRKGYLFKPLTLVYTPDFIVLKWS